MGKPNVRLLDLFRNELGSIRIVDVGAMWMGQEHVAYKALLRRGASRVVGFEPVKAECDKLNAKGLPNQTYLPYFIGDGTERTFYETNPAFNSSLYEPNLPLLKMFATLGDIYRVVSSAKVRTQRLDDIAEIEGMDFLKIDAQGGELDVLRGAERLLRDCLVVQTEVEFVEMYKGQALFADIDAHMRRSGFVLHKIASFSGRAFLPVTNKENPHALLSQWVWGDAVYVRDFTRLDELSPEKLLTLAAIVNDVYDSFDLAALALQRCDAQTHSGKFAQFLKAMTG